MVEDTPKNPFQGLSDDCRKKMMNNLLKACCKNFGKNADGEDEDCSHEDIKSEDKKDEKKDKPAVVFKDPNLMKIDLEDYLQQLDQLSQKEPTHLIPDCSYR